MISCPTGWGRAQLPQGRKLAVDQVVDAVSPTRRRLGHLAVRRVAQTDCYSSPARQTWVFVAHRAAFGSPMS